MADRPDPAMEPPREQGISLRELSEAFAQAMSRHAQLGPGDAAAVPEEGPQQTTAQQEATAGEPAPLAPPGPPDMETASDAADDPSRLSPLSLVEAMLFVGNREGQPLTAVTAAGLMRGVEPGEIPGLVEQLNRRYAAGACPYQVVSEGPGYRLAMRHDYSWLRDQFFGRVREARLSQAAVDVLAIVAYRQPITAEEVSRLRGRPSSHILTQLVRRRLLRIERPPEKPRAIRYFTTDRFLELFGLESLSDLPQTDDPEGQ